MLMKKMNPMTLQLVSIKVLQAASSLTYFIIYINVLVLFMVALLLAAIAWLCASIHLSLKPFFVSLSHCLSSFFRSEFPSITSQICCFKKK